MSEQRFTIQKASGMYLHLPIFDNDVEMADGDVCILLNEQQAKIEKIEKENRELNSIKKFAEKNGINIFLIEEAFRKCWKDNGKLFEENEKLRFLIDINSVSERKKLERQVDEQQATISALKEENEQLKHYKLYEDNKRLQTKIADLKEENEQLRMKLKGDDYIMVSEMLSNLRKTGICDGCKNKDKPVEWYLERGFSITGQICDRYEPEV